MRTYALRDMRVMECSRPCFLENDLLVAFLSGCYLQSMVQSSSSKVFTAEDLTDPWRLSVSSFPSSLVCGLLHEDRGSQTSPEFQHLNYHWTGFPNLHHVLDCAPWYSWYRPPVNASMAIHLTWHGQENFSDVFRKKGWLQPLTPSQTDPCFGTSLSGPPYAEGWPGQELMNRTAQFLSWPNPYLTIFIGVSTTMRCT